MALMLITLLFCSAASVQATTNTTVVPVACPDHVVNFTASTTMVFEGRTEMPSMEEESTLREEFELVYNTLSETNCDSFFRRISNLTMIRMGVVGMEMDMDMDMDMDSNSSEAVDVARVGGRLLQNSTDGVNSTSDVSAIEMTYRVQGTCRGCALTESGSFDLYDEAFRRLLLRSRKLLVDEPSRQLTENEDCQCVEGTLPVEPRAPGVQECVDAMNEQFDNLEEQEGLFEDLRLTDLIQLDEGIDANSSSPTTAPTTAPTNKPVGTTSNWWG